MARGIESVSMETIVSLCKRRGIIFPGSEIYGGLANAWDYGPAGVEMKRNVKDAWWRDMVLRRDDVVGLDCALIMHPKTWEASGHLASFSDPYSNCPGCGRNWRADHVPGMLWESEWWLSLRRVLLNNPTWERAIPRWAANDGKKQAPNLAFLQNPDPIRLAFAGASAATAFDGPNDPSFSQFMQHLTGGKAPRPACGGGLSEPKPANLMLATFLGPIRATALEVYLRPETAQGMFVNFRNVATATRRKLPFGIAQMGKSFRNEITPGNFTFRTREFEQMEMEFFVKPGDDERWHDYWINERFDWYVRHGIRKENLRIRAHEKAELSHYSKATSDVEYRFPWGWAELEGIANRTDYDLKQHAKFSGQDLSYFDEDTKEHLIPYVVEPAAGADRAMLAFLVDAYDEEDVRGEKRTVLHLHPSIAPVKAAVLPLSRHEQLVPLAKDVHKALRSKGRWPVEYDDAQSIGRRYRRFDELGAPLCVTVDFQSLEDKQVTVRERDSMEQTRVPIADLERVLAERLGL